MASYACYDKANRSPMENLPKRTSLVRETANTLKVWIEDGILSGVLPGEMQLKNRLGVGRDTLRLALRLLENEGWTTPTSQGRQRRVQIGSHPARQKPDALLPVTFLSPARMVDRQVLLEMWPCPDRRTGCLRRSPARRHPERP